MNTVSMALSDRAIDTTRHSWMENWKQSPHRLHVGYSASLNPELYKIFTKVPPLRFSMEYMYDISWKHKRTNFFVLGGIAYDGGVREDVPYRAKNNVVYEDYDFNRFHLYAGLGFNVRLMHFLNISVSYAGGYGYSREHGNYSDRNWFTDVGFIPDFRERHVYRGIFSARLTGEIKNVQIYAGYENAHGIRDWEMMGCSLISIGIGYRF